MSKPAWWLNDKPSKKRIKAALALYAPVIKKEEIFREDEKNPLPKKATRPIIKPV